MALAAAPPDLFVAARGHHLGRERAVQILRPLCGDPGLLRREVVESGKHAPPGAVRAVAPACVPRRDDRLELMPQRTAPPHAAVAVRRDVLRRERRVLFRVPLLREPRVGRCEVVFPRVYALARTVRAAGASGARRYARPPLVPVRAAPPDPAA